MICQIDLKADPGRQAPQLTAEPFFFPSCHMSGLPLIMASVFAYCHPRIRNLEEEIPDAIPDDEITEKEVVGEGVPTEAVATPGD